MNLGQTRIALIQMGCGPDPEKNFARAIEFVRKAAGKGAKIVCLPELFRSQYFCQAEYHENFEFTPGDLGFQAWRTTHGSLGVCVCWDQWYPEAARLTALRGAEIIFYPTAIGWHPSEKKEFGKAQFSAWQTMQRSHAIANGCFVAAANRVGHEAPAGGDGIEFWGQSFICAPSGEILAQGSFDREEIVSAEVEWKRVDQHRTHWPFLRDRRVDAYEGIQQRLID